MERLTTERLEFLALGLADRERAYEEGRVGAQGGLVSFITEENAMARELLALRREVEQLSADRYAEQQRREAAEARVARLLPSSLPSVLYRPRLTRDGNAWCALYGEDLQEGVAGFGRSPAEAMAAFDAAWVQEVQQ